MSISFEQKVLAVCTCFNMNLNCQFFRATYKQLLTARKKKNGITVVEKLNPEVLQFYCEGKHQLITWQVVQLLARRNFSELERRLTEAQNEEHSIG